MVALFTIISKVDCTYSTILGIIYVTNFKMVFLLLLLFLFLLLHKAVDRNT